MLNRRTFCGVISIALIALTAIMITEQNTLDALVETCNPYNPNCNYQVKDVGVIHIGIHDCKEGHTFYKHVKGYRVSSMAWCSVHSNEPKNFHGLRIRCVGYPVNHNDNEGDEID